MNSLFDPRYLTRNILIGMALGAAIGTGLNMAGATPEAPGFIAGELFQLLGDVFVRSLQVLVVPLVLLSLIVGTASLDDVRKLGRIGVKTLAFYIGTTAAAITIAMLLAVVFRAGSGFELNLESSFSATESPGLRTVLTNIFPQNPFAAMAEGNMLQVIVFAILIGISMCLAGAPGQRGLAIAKDMN